MKPSSGRRAAVVSLALALAAAAIAAPAASAQECAAPMPISQVHAGMSAKGWTVARGSEPEPFRVDVLGIVADGVGPGRDMIVVKTESGAIDAARGIWAGMSGSPVYDDATGELIGVVAYGLSFGPSKIGGLTPAADLVDVLDYSRAARAAAGAAASVPQAVPLPPRLVRRIAAAIGARAADVGDTLVRLKLPLSASGISYRGMARLSRFLEKRKLPFVPYAGSSASATPVAPSEALEPGDNFAAALSYGDVTLAAVGTTSYVCAGEALAFGHPFLFGGRTTMGANAADAIAIVDDPVFGPYKLASLAATLGTVDQDRLAAIRAVLGDPPPTAPVRSWVRSLDSGAFRTGETEIVFPSFVPFIAFLHLFSNIDTTFDQVGPGTGHVWWSVDGARRDGSAWRLVRLNQYVSDYDISIASAEELLSKLELLASNPLEKVRITGVRAGARVEETVRKYVISRVLVAVGRGRYRERNVVRARPGSLLRVRVVLVASDGAPTRRVEMKLRVPRRVREGLLLEIAGAPEGPPPICFPTEPCEGGIAVETFDELLRVLQGQRRNTDLLARLVSFDEQSETERAVRWRRVGLDRYVSGSRFVFVLLE